MTLRRLAPAAAALALVAGCGGDGDETSATQTRTVVQTVTQAAEPAPAGKRAAPAPRAPTAQAVTQLTGFSSPSKNIGCYIDRSSVRCDIRRRSWRAPRPPRSCELDFGQGIALSPGRRAGFVCAGDTALGPARILSYGKAIRAGRLRCDSRRSGMTCRDARTRRGFTLSRERYDLF